MSVSAREESEFSDWEYVEHENERLGNESDDGEGALPVSSSISEAVYEDNRSLINCGARVEDIPTSSTLIEGSDPRDDSENLQPRIPEENMEEAQEGGAANQEPRNSFLSRNLHNLQDFPDRLALSHAADLPAANDDRASAVLQAILSNRRVIAGFGVLAFFICRLHRLDTDRK
ncbi:hypothetical protein BSKO_11927 [Bryopsis sp. KO-2023]|nr:hypothetical protein BSKO_11927 [Bryopsis sp. KO-2023]